MRAALTGRPDPDAFARCLVVIAAVDIGALRRLASLAVRVTPTRSAP
ncbi:MAG: hypothetical protein H6736_03900 [Alphaproteobacteria bacterium]|nr:hypothetical protein [Alphaproteobacteria bacterium]